MLAIFVGVRMEHHAVGRHVDILERLQTEEGYFLSRGTFRDKPVLICRTGLGEERIKGIVDKVIHEHPISAIVSARFASGVPADLRKGDLAFTLRTQLYDTDLGVLSEPTGEVDRRLLELGGRAATAAEVRHMVGDCLTLTPLRPEPVPREQLGGMAQVLTVDTEGYWLAEAAFEHDVPFLSVRVSLGDVYDGLPETISMLGKRSYVSTWTILRQNLAHPTRLPNFIRLADAIRTCCKTMSAFTGAFLREWAEHPVPARSLERER
jgi:nucleoside phosphorylase